MFICLKGQTTPAHTLSKLITMWELPLEMLGDALWNIVQGPHERRVKRYLNEATQDSVLKDLQERLKSRSSYVWYLGASFDTCAYGLDQKYWNEESFQKYIESSHPGLISSKASLELLWRCFHFYAFYPFPRDATNGMIDYNAFQRAVTLLSARGADLLGFVDGEDWHWLCDNSYITRTNFQRIIRSIGFTHSIGREGLQKGTEENSIVNETMDVLKMTAPFQMHCGPWKDQLEPVVRRILGESASSRSEVPWGQLSELLSLVLRVRLLPTRRTLGIHFGEFEDPGPANETAMRIVNALREDITEDDIASKHYVRLIEVLPDLHIQFHQFWAVLFQPPQEVTGKVPKKEG